MADSDKNILITPNRGSTTDLPKIEFTGADPNTITLSVLDDATLSFSGASGQLFSISDSLTGTIFSVNDVSGIPSIEVDDDGTVRLAEFAGNLLVGTDVDAGDHKVQIKSDVYNHPLHITSAFGDKIKLTSTHASIQSNSIDFYANDKNMGSVRGVWSSNFKQVSLGVSFDTDANTQGRRLYIPMTGNPYFRYGATSDYEIYHAGNKPTPAAIGALSTSGKAADSNLLDGIDSSRIVYGSNTNKTVNTSSAAADLPSGFYDQYQGDMPTSTYYSYINMRHTNEANHHGGQIAVSFYDPTIYSRHYQGGNSSGNGTFSDWVNTWNSVNDGSGSGLDADLLDGADSPYYDHRVYTSTGNYLGGHYVSGGPEKPNSSALGAGKLKPIMLSGTNVGVGSAWNDVLWISAYTGSDVKRSTALISSKYDNTSVWVNKANYDASSWGTSYLFWNSGNDGPGTGLNADLLDGVEGASFLRSDADDTASGQYSFTKVTDHAIKVGTIRGTAVGGQTGQFIQLYERVNIGGPSGWGDAATTAAPTYGLSTYGGAHLATHAGEVKIGRTISQSHGGLQILRNGGTPTTSGYSVANGASIEIYSNNQPVIGFHNSGNSACSLYESSGDLYLTRWNGTATGSRLWHSNNDGSGSGLDADLLDGTQGWDVAGLDYLGWAPAYSNNDSNTIRYYHAAGAVGLQGSDTSMGMAYKAVYVPPGSTISFSIAAKASAASSSGFYLRIYGRSSLSDGKTHVSHTAGTSPLVEEDQFGNTGWIENAAIGTDWKVYKKDHTTNAGGWFSLVALNWSGMGTNVLYVRKPEIVIKQTTTDREIGTYVMAYQNATDATALNIGDTISGSSLRPAAIMPAGNSVGASPSTNTSRINGATISIPGTDDNSTLSGTWRLMGAYADNYSYNDFPVSLWLRIS